jgi:ABC-type uncharacterized transport system substrate-binding protein
MPGPAIARLACFLLLVATITPAAAAPAGPSILIVYETGNSVHETVYETIKGELTDRQRDHRPFDLRSATPDTRDDAERGHPDLIVTIGVRAAVSQHREGVNSPILSVLVPRSAYETLSKDFAGRSTAIFLDQPIERQFAVARAMLPRASQAGMLQGSSTKAGDNAEPDAPQTFGLEPNWVTLDPDADPADAIEALLATSDVVIATFDPEVYRPATAKWLLYLAFQKRRPIIGFSSALLKAGAVAAVFSTPANIANHAADLIGDWLETGRLPDDPAFPRYFHIGINAPVSARLGLGRPRQAVVEQAVRTLLEATP